METGQSIREWTAVHRTAEGLHGRNVRTGPQPRDALAIVSILQEIARLIDELSRQAPQASGQDLERAQELQDRQRDLENRLEQAQSEAEQVSSQMPIAPEGMEEMLDEAQERMQNAGEDLGQGRGMAAEGSQSGAAERIRRARSALEQAMRASQQISQGGGGGGGEGEGQGGGDEQDGDGQQAPQSAELFIPGREAYQTPEAYRKALLEGMEGEVPEAYRAWKQRYYEELVEQ